MKISVKSSKELLKKAIKGEQDGMKFYGGLAEKATNPEAKRKLFDLAKDEKRHEATLVKLYKNLHHEETGPLPKQGIGVLERYFGDSKGRDRQSEVQLIDMAIETELAVTKFYKDAAKTVDDEEFKKVCQELAEEEFAHFELLQAEKEALGGNYYWFGYGEGSPMEE